MKYTREEWIEKEEELYKTSKDYNERIFYKAANKTLDVLIKIGLIAIAILILTVLLR